MNVISRHERNSIAFRECHRVVDELFAGFFLTILYLQKEISNTEHVFERFSIYESLFLVTIYKKMSDRAIRST